MTWWRRTGQRWKWAVLGVGLAGPVLGYPHLPLESMDQVRLLLAFAALTWFFLVTRCPACGARIAWVVARHRPVREWARIGALQACPACGDRAVAFDADLEYAHRHSSGHRAEVMRSASCACFHCMAVFAPDEIREWVDEGQGGGGRSALCPRCGIDAVIGSASNVPLDSKFLARMRRYWFER